MRQVRQGGNGATREGRRRDATQETRLDTSFTPGGSLNVGNALIRRYTNPTTAQIFDCEATALIQGNLNVLLDIGVSQSASVALDTTIGRNINFTGSAVGGPWSFTSGIRSTFTNEITNQQLYQGITGAPAINLQSLAGSGPLRQVTSVIGHSVLRVDLSTYTGIAPNDCEGIILPTVASSTPGQILTVIIDAAAGASLASGFFYIDAANFAPGAVSTQIQMGNLTPTNSNDIRKLAVTLFADASGWRVLNITQASAGDITY
jgi:hypothetical protein